MEECYDTWDLIGGCTLIRCASGMIGCFWLYFKFPILQIVGLFWFSFDSLLLMCRPYWLVNCCKQIDWLTLLWHHTIQSWFNCYAAFHWLTLYMTSHHSFMVNCYDLIDWLTLMTSHYSFMVELLWAHWLVNSLWHHTIHSWFNCYEPVHWLTLYDMTPFMDNLFCSRFQWEHLYVCRYQCLLLNRVFLCFVWVDLGAVSIS